MHGHPADERVTDRETQQGAERALDRAERLHKAFLARQGGDRAVLRGRDLTSANLSGRYPAESDFSESLLCRALSRRTRFDGTRLNGAIVEGGWDRGRPSGQRGIKARPAAGSPGLLAAK